MKAIVIPPDAPPYLDNLSDPPTLEQLQKLVGGYIEAVPLLGGPHAQGYCNEEGKILDLPMNVLATHHADIFPNDYIAGTFVILGPTDENGYDTEVPKRLIDLFCGAA